MAVNVSANAISLLTTNTFLSLSVAVLSVSLVLYKRSTGQKLPYAPGPPTKDFISGNARDLTAGQLWFTLTDWASAYGPLIYLKSFNKSMLVLNSLEDAVELMEKRSNNYSDRSEVPLINMTGWTYATPFKPYGAAWQAHRRVLQQIFKATASLTYRPTQTEKVNDMLYNLLNAPEDFLSHIRTLSVSIIMSSMYGYKVGPKDDHFQQLAEAAMTALSQSAYPSASIVNILPFLRFLPEWFPGASVFHRFARVAKVKVDQMQDVPYKYVQDNMAAGTASPSFVADFVEGCKTDEDHHKLKEIAATAYAGGADTTTSSMGTFFYAMAKFPEVQKKAQEELDRVVGTDRLATFDDESSLPYIQALCREVFRWRPVLPLGIFHATTAEDVYKGYYIPQGTTIIPNIWAMSRDTSKYKDPEDFNPDRFFDENNDLNKDDASYTFGFGRRICPGRHMAYATVYLAVATILGAFIIRPAKDASGKEIPVDAEYSGGMISHPLPFQCSVTPRSDRMKQVIIDLNNNAM